MAASTRDHVSAAEWVMRVDLAACFRLVASFGWSDLLGTHISARVPGGGNEFLINPYGLLFDEITASSLVKVDEAGNILSPTEYSINPARFFIHGAVHIARPEVACVLHTHTPGRHPGLGAEERHPAPDPAGAAGDRLYWLSRL